MGNCDIDFFIIRQRVCIVGAKFLKLERVKNVAERFQKLQKRKHEITKLYDFVI
jgi:hypothetical protein